MTVRSLVPSNMGRWIDAASELGKIAPWLPHPSASVCWTHTGFPDSPLALTCAAFLAIRRHGSLPSSGAQKRSARNAAKSIPPGYDRTTRRARDLSSADTRIYLQFEVRRLRCPCNGKVRGERLDFLADNPLYTKRFAWFVGRRCRSSTIKDVAKELNLHWGTVKELDKAYMRVQLERAGRPGPKAIGIDEISIRKGHTYRIVVSDLIRGRPIWFGGKDRARPA
ncbi:MAG: ISL3 family transposase [Sterolibacteriaceae bacterium]|nr:ISL3 family transposase [Sterolibacteriaceae bacterium]